MRILEIKLDILGGVSHYKITSKKGCCYKNMMSVSVKERLSDFFCSEALLAAYKRSVEQQQTIQELTELVQLMGGVIRFYGLGKSWGWGDNSQGKTLSFIRMDYSETIKNHFLGGKRAREIQENELFKKYYEGEK